MIGMELNPGKYVCTISAIGNVLHHQGNILKEYEVYVLSDGFRTSYCDGYVAINSLQGISESLTNCGLFRTRWGVVDSDSLDTITSFVRNGTPVIVLIHTDGLDFDHRLSKKYGFYRSFIIRDYDEQTGLLTLSDTFCINDAQEIQVIDFEVPLKWLRTIAREYLVITPGTDTSQDLGIQSLLLSNLNHYLTSTAPDSRQGAVRMHLNHLNEVFTSGSDEDLLKACYYISNTIRFGTFIPMLSYLIDYVQEYEDRFNSGQLLNELKSLKMEWNILSNKAIKLTVSQREGRKQEFLNRYEQLFGTSLEALQRVVSAIEEHFLTPKE
ncbi:hypothetical protein KIH86_13515 [Paenibacillus sp. HN-1]|uniref:hypothetical protein n=1 Tax=Paenibacillus TaxID=44249 RepID=UPI001CA7C6FB|nr:MULTISPECIES: hypothetical protein [Paenibacillus]MBY9080762.1 hypothetical protein [Paenibacillus sp. CGMCC 1.18879]MBY9085246.1 hypothetical protein [Paenibacillus sinensis]